MSKLKGVLIIDDNETSNFLNHRLLKRLEISEHIQIFDNGNQALGYLQTVERQDFDSADLSYFKPELILLDVNMPGLDGFEFLEIYKGFPHEFKDGTVIAMLSTSTHPQDMIRASEYGASYMFKPLTADKIKNLLSEKFASF